MIAIVQIFSFNKNSSRDQLTFVGEVIGEFRQGYWDQSDICAILNDKEIAIHELHRAIQIQSDMFDGFTHNGSRMRWIITERADKNV